MSKTTTSFGLLATGAVIGFAYTALNRAQNTTSNTQTSDTPTWERHLHKVASLPWHYLHPAGQLVTNENLESVLSAVRRARQGRPATATVTPPASATMEQEPTKDSIIDSEEPSMTTDENPTPEQKPVNYQETLRNLANQESIRNLTTQATTQAEKFVRRYQEDPEFRANVKQAGEIGASILKNVRARGAGRRPGGKSA